jgi:hypothetical protein
MAPMIEGRLPGLLAAALCFAFLLVPIAGAAQAAGEVTRAGYREAVEPICRSNTEANERILAGVKQEVRAGRLAPAATRFARAAYALKKTIGELKGVAPPPADRARLSRWLGKVSVEASLFERIAGELRARQKARAEKLVVRLNSNAGQANNMVIAFEFEYCRLEPARFT